MPSLLLAGAFAILGIWVYLRPQQSLEKFNRCGKPSSKFALRKARFVELVAIRFRGWVPGWSLWANR
jgi:hypothetical protein